MRTRRSLPISSRRGTVVLFGVPGMLEPRVAALAPDKLLDETVAPQHGDEITPPDRV